MGLSVHGLPKSGAEQVTARLIFRSECQPYSKVK